jgi:integrase
VVFTHSRNFSGNKSLSSSALSGEFFAGSRQAHFSTPDKAPQRVRSRLPRRHGLQGYPNMPLFPGRYSMTEPLPQQLSRDGIEPARTMVADPNARVSRRTGEPDRRYVKADAHALAIRCAPSSGYKWSVPVNPAGLAKHPFEPALAALGFDHVRWHDLRHAFAVMSLTAGEHYMAVSKMLGHAIYVTS